MVSEQDWKFVYSLQTIKQKHAFCPGIAESSLPTKADGQPASNGLLLIFIGKDKNGWRRQNTLIPPLHETRDV